MYSAKTYDPKKITIVLDPGGEHEPHILEGFADDVFVRVMRDEPSYKLVKGLYGVVIRVRTLSRSGKMIVTLLQSSVSNKWLSEMASYDENNFGREGRPDGVMNLTFTEKWGSVNTQISSSACWIEKYPEVVYGKNIELREWTIALADVSIFLDEGYGGIY